MLPLLFRLFPRPLSMSPLLFRLFPRPLSMLPLLFRLFPRPLSMLPLSMLPLLFRLFSRPLSMLPLSMLPLSMLRSSMLPSSMFPRSVSPRDAETTARVSGSTLCTSCTSRSPSLDSSFARFLGLPGQKKPSKRYAMATNANSAQLGYSAAKSRRISAPCWGRTTRVMLSSGKTENLVSPSPIAVMRLTTYLAASVIALASGVPPGAHRLAHARDTSLVIVGHVLSVSSL